jgi:PAS domain S-box-containing protein
MAALSGQQALDLLETIVVPTIVLDGEGRIEWMNGAAERLLAWPRAQLEGQPVEALFPARLHIADGRRLPQRLADRAGRAPERPFRIPALRRDGVEIECECSISALADGALAISLQRRIESYGVDTLESAPARPPEAGPAAAARPVEHAQLYRLLFDHAPLGIWHFDERGVITACNDPFVRMIGSSKRALVGLNQLTLHDSFVVDCVRGTLAGQRTHNEGDYRSATAGKVTPVRADFAPIRDDEGRVIGGVGLLEDITARKRAEDQLRESNAALRAVFEASPLPIVSMTGDRRVRMWNPAASRVFGFTEAEVIGQPFPCVPPEREPDFRGRFDAVIAGDVLVGYETYYLRRDGSRLEVNVSAAPLRAGNVDAVIAVLSDITESKRALVERAQLLQQEQAARRAAEQAQRRLESLAEASAQIASSLDYDDTLRRAARMATPHFAQLGVVYLRDDEGRVAEVAVEHPDADRATTARSTLAAPSPVVYDVLRGGRSRFAAAPPLGWPALEALDVRAFICVPLLVLGRVVGVLALGRDAAAEPFTPVDVPIAEEIGRRARVANHNARLLRKNQQALRWRDEFLSVASHELRTPVTSLSLSAQNLESMAAEGTLAAAAPDVVGRGLATVVRQSRHLGRLIEELLDLSRIQAGRFEVVPTDGVDLVKVVRATAGRLERELALAGSTLRIDAPGAIVGSWDRSRLDQVITNLLTNATKFGAGKPIEVTVSASDDAATLVVADHGVGIAPEQQARIFERFERAVSARHYGGLGLGLYIVRQIVDAHHGAISVASRPGQGATFTVALPRQQP